MVRATMHLRLVRGHDAHTAPAAAPREADAALDAYPFAETPLVVTFAARDDLSSIAPDVAVTLAAVPDLSVDDAYLVLPLRARESLLAAFARGSLGRVAQWFDEARVVRAEVSRVRGARLHVQAAWRAGDVIERRVGRRVALAGVGNAMRVVNQLAFIEGLAPGGLLDAHGAETILAREHYVGVSRMGVEALGLGADAVESTFVWTQRSPVGTHVRVALAAADEDSPLALLAPVTLVA